MTDDTRSGALSAVSGVHWTADGGRETPEFRSYLRARDAVVRIQRASTADAVSGFGGTSGGAAPSAYWVGELDNIDYMIDATPLIVRKLRHHAFHITGIRPYQYRDNEDGRRENFEQRLRALRAIGGDALLVPESPALGGFGFTVDGRLFNVDTLKGYEVLIGMERGGVLSALRSIDRPVVCEIGAGWGGFAYQFKTLLPRTTYVIVDFPELFLFSATYLGTVFPDARIRFVGTESSARIDEWRDADFVFVPHTLSRLVSALPLDLTVNMVSFQEMTETQVHGYACMAAAAGCPLLYSLNRERSLYNGELVSVSEVLAGWYNLTEVPLLETDYTNALRKPAKRTRKPDSAEPHYRHLVGRLASEPRARGASTPRENANTPADGPRVILGMTLHNKVQHLPDAIESLLSQTYRSFGLYLLDDASTDATEVVARQYVARDARVRYARHAERQAMIPTWREAAELAAREWPSAEYFAWVSDHDWWHPLWLEWLVAELDADSRVVLAYPFTRRVSPTGENLDKEPRRFATAAGDDVAARWQHFCHEGVGAGDMVYGLVRLDVLRKAGVFRPVLRPDRLLVAELSLHGGIRQVPEVLWFRRQFGEGSVARQRHSLLVEGTEPSWFWYPPWLQHAVILNRAYVSQLASLGLTRWRWRRMLLRYQLTYGWRHFRKTETSHAIGRAIDDVIWLKKQTKHYYHHAVYNTLVGARAAWGKTRRAWRRTVYEVLTFTHRAGLRGQR